MIFNLKKCFTFSLCYLVLLLSCTKNNNNRPQNPASANPELGIDNKIPDELGRDYQINFNRYTKVQVPNGSAIHIVAQDAITDEQMVRCRNILNHFLNDYLGSEFGNDKSNVANKMADNGAVLVLLNGQDDGSNNVNVDGQYLFQNEIQVEGGAWYINQNYDHRDAAYEEILHLVHDFGIGVDGHNSYNGALPLFQSEIRKAQENALNNNLWGIGASAWIDELSDENSLSQEYLAALIDSYYGLWGAWSESDTHGMWGLYVAKTREEIALEDPMGYALLQNKFFHPYISYNARIDSSMSGVFSLKFDASIPYTYHSQYLKEITLLGSNDCAVIVNELDNTVKGNNGYNSIIFSGNFEDYSITISSNETIITDNVLNRDGTNRVTDIEALKFIDKTVEL
ncbi:MAG: hypothetical protein AAGK97_02970 [Bacteroidota bacterium]